MAAAAQARRLASPTLRSLARRRFAELGGLALGLVGLALLVALATYHARDPSLNTASGHAVANLAGPVGAMLADLLLQGFGLAGALPGLAMLAWAWRIASHRGLGSLAARIAATLAGLPVVASVLAAVPWGHGHLAWPTPAGLGGAVGVLLGNGALTAGRDVLGPVGTGFVAMIGIGLAITLVLLALGLTAGEWRAAGRGAASVARYSSARGIGAA